MAEQRSEVEIALKTTADTSGTKEVQRDLQSIRDAQRALDRESRSPRAQGPQVLGAAQLTRAQEQQRLGPPQLTPAQVQAGLQRQSQQEEHARLGPQPLSAAQLTRAMQQEQDALDKAAQELQRAQERMGPQPLSAAQLTRALEQTQKQIQQAADELAKAQAQMGPQPLGAAQLTRALQQKQKEQEQQLKQQQQQMGPFEQPQPIVTAFRRNIGLTPQGDQPQAPDQPLQGTPQQAQQQLQGAQQTVDQLRQRLNEARQGQQQRQQNLNQLQGASLPPQALAGRDQAIKEAEEQLKQDTQTIAELRQKLEQAQTEVDRAKRTVSRFATATPKQLQQAATRPPGGGPPSGAQGGGGSDDENNGPTRGQVTSTLRFAAALTGVGLGISIVAGAGRLLRQGFIDIVGVQEREIQTLTNLRASYSSLSPTLEDFAQRLGKSQEAFGAPATRQALEVFRPLQTQVHLTVGQVEELTTAATKLADIRNLPLVQVAGALRDALSGSTGAAEQLGLKIDDVTVASTYMNGKFATTFQTLSQQEQAQARLSVALQETARIQKDTAGATDEMARSQRELGQTWLEFQQTFGPTVFNIAKGAVDNLKNSLTTLRDSLKGFNELTTGTGATREAQGPVYQQQTPQQLSNNVVQGTEERAESQRKTIGEAVGLVGELVKQEQKLPEGVRAFVGAWIPALNAIDQAAAGIEALKKAQEDQDKQLKQTVADSREINQIINRNNQAQIENTEVAGQATGKVAEQVKAVADEGPTLARVWADFSKGAADAATRVGQIRGAVSNISTLTPQQTRALAQREAESASLRQRLLQEQTQQQGQLEQQLRSAIGNATTDDNRQALQAQLQNLQQIQALTLAWVQAQQEVNRLQQESVQLSGQEAQAQLNVLNVTRAAQDNELRIQRDRFIAQDRLRSAPERAAARRDVRQANILQPDLQLRAFDANAPVRAIQRQEEANGLLTRIAAATEAARAQQLDINLAVSGDFSVSVTGSSGPIPADAGDRIAASVQRKTAEAFAAARKKAENQPSSSLSLTK